MRYRGLFRQLKPRANGLRAALSIPAALTILSTICGPHRFDFDAPPAPGPPPCLTVAAAGPVWQNFAFVAAQNGTFTAEVDATPLGGGIDAGVGLSNGPQTAYGGLACAARFNSAGKIEARNGGAYAAATVLPYFANTSYHFRFVVNVSAHTYSIYVTPAGGAQQTLGVNYAFRTEQAAVGSLNNWSLWGEVGAMRACGFGAPCHTATAGGGWLNNAFASQGGAFTAEWDATPLAANIDAVLALSNGAQTDFPGFACLTRFNSQGGIEARDGGTYRAAAAISYVPNTIYHFRLAVNVAAHTYSIYVTPAGGSEQLLGLNYAFRAEQATVASLNNFGLLVDSANGSARVCNFALGGSNTLFQDTFTGADGLITNEYAAHNADGITSPDWAVTSGTLYRQAGTGWTGVPGSCDNPDRTSSNCNNSDVFRANTIRTFGGNVKVSLALKNNSEIHNPNCGATETCWHGVHVWLRHKTQYDLYAVSINRADNLVVIKRKVPCGSSNNGHYEELKQPNGQFAHLLHPWTTGTWQHFSVTVQTNADGSVTLKVYDDDGDPNTPFLIGTDTGGTNPEWPSQCPPPKDGQPQHYPTNQYPPLTAAGGVGVRGDFDDFNIENFTVTSF
jgi:hypothetical protein